MTQVNRPASFASQIWDRRSLDTHTGFAGDDGEGSASLHHRNHLRPIGSVGLRLEGMACLDGKPGLFASLGKENGRGRIGILGQRDRDIGIRVRSEHPVRVAIKPHLAVRRLEGQRAQAALDSVRPSVQRERGCDRDERESRSKNGGRNLHGGKGLSLGMTLLHSTTYESITYVLCLPVSTVGAARVPGGANHER
jgi:hypothetical protein